jgi:hypothetical protein
MWKKRHKGISLMKTYGSCGVGHGSTREAVLHDKSNYFSCNKKPGNYLFPWLRRNLSWFTVPLSKHLLPQFIASIMLRTSNYFSPPDDTIKSARDWLYRPPISANFLIFLHGLEKVDIAVTIPFRIVQAWACEEENKEDIVYIEAILPEKTEVFPEVHVMEKTDTVEGKHKLTRFLVCFEDYKQLIMRQKHQLGLSRLHLVERR